MVALSQDLTPRNIYAPRARGLGTRTDFLRPIRPGHPSPRGGITPTTVHLLLQLSRLSRITVPQHQSRMRMVICREHYLARRTSCLGVLLPAHNL